MVGRLRVLAKAYLAAAVAEQQQQPGGSWYQCSSWRASCCWSVVGLHRSADNQPARSGQNTPPGDKEVGHMLLNSCSAAVASESLIVPTAKGSPRVFANRR